MPPGDTQGAFTLGITTGASVDPEAIPRNSATILLLITNLSGARSLGAGGSPTQLCQGRSTVKWNQLQEETMAEYRLSAGETWFGFILAKLMILGGFRSAGVFESVPNRSNPNSAVLGSQAWDRNPAERLTQDK
jgi:hypothetical protein